jgi:hypothetical protein
MPIVQISRIQHRRGKRTDLPQLAAGELGWVIDEQRLFIGNGTVADGAPAVGNTEIVTAGGSGFSTALTHVYKGYLGDATPIVTGASGDFSRTLQQVLDDHVSVKAFGAVGDGDTAATILAATDDTAAIQRAIDQLYIETDKVDSDSRRVLFFPAGKYKITSALKIPPYAHLVGEGPEKTIIYNTGNNAVAVTQDNAGNVGAGITAAVTQIQVSNMTLKNSVAYGGVSLDRASKVYFNNCRFEGSYASGGPDAPTSKGVTIDESTAVLTTNNVTFSQCQFAKFARLVDLSWNSTHIKFNDCDFTTAYYGALLGAEVDGSTAGLDVGPRNVHFTGSSWSDIGQQAIWVKPASGANTGTEGGRNIISSGNWYASTVGNNFEGVGSIREVPILQFDNDECTSISDFFERSDLRRADGSSELNAAPELQGIGIQDKAIRSITLTDATTGATINEYPALAGKGLRIKYKIVRGTNDRTGELVVSASTNGVSYDDTFTESGSDVGVELTVDQKTDGSSVTNTVVLKYTTTDTSGTPGDATLDYQTTIIA